MKTITKIIALGVFVSLAGCGKKKLTETEIMPDGRSGSPLATHEAQWTYSAKGKYDASGNPMVEYDCTANFFTDNLLDPNQCEDVGTLDIGGIQVNTDPATWGCNAYYFNATNKTAVQNSVNFGSVTNFSVSGAGSYAPVLDNFYVPEEIFLGNLPSGCGLQEIKQSLLPHPITWNADPLNSDVGVYLIYNGALSHELNPSLSDQSFSHEILAPDNGTYFITSADLATFPVGSVINVCVGRAGEKEVMSNGRTILIDALAYSERAYQYVP